MSLYPDTIYARISETIATRQYVSAQGIGQFRGEFGGTASSVEETWDIKGVENLGLFASQALGYALAAGPKIDRVLPAKHGVLDYMWVSKMSVEGQAPSGVIGAADTADWNIVRCKITYETPPYDMLANDMVGLGEEWRRFTTWTQENAEEFFVRQQDVFVYNSGETTPTQLRGQIIPGGGGRAQLVTKQRRIATWYAVPDNGLFSNGGFNAPGRATNIERCVGKVNNASYLGFEAGTLLLESWKPVPRTYPVQPDLVGLAPFQVPRCWDVELQFLFFDPDPGDPLKRGHNLVPDPVSGKWYRAHFNGGSDESKDWRYQETNFDTIFRMNTD